MRLRPILQTLIVAAAWVAAALASAAEIKVLTAGAFKPVVAALAPAFEAQTGHTVRVENATAGALVRRIAQGEAFDVVVLTPAAMQPLVQANRVVPGSVVRLAQVNAEGPARIEDVDADHPLVESYDLLRQLMPLITKYQGTAKMAGILQSVDQEGITIDVGAYRANVRYNRQAKGQADMSYGLIINTGPDEYLVAGNGFQVNFSPATPGPRHAGILQVWEGVYEGEEWLPGRCLNGDETGAHWVAKLPPNDHDRFAGSDRPRILRVTLYRHD